MARVIALSLAAALMVLSTISVVGWVSMRGDGVPGAATECDDGRIRDRSGVCVRQHVADLLEDLSMEELVGQMTQLDVAMMLESDGITLDNEKLQECFETYGVGSLFSSPFAGGKVGGKVGFTAQEYRSFIGQIQDAAIKYGNHSIPMIYGLDSVHGAHYVLGAAIFPHNINLGASFNISLANTTSHISSRDTRCAATPWNFHPVAGVGLQPLWPRLYETFGEDPFLCGEMTYSAIMGVEGDNISAEDRCASSLKHYIGYPATDSGKDRGDASISDIQLRQIFLPPFERGLEAAPATMMINSGSVNGVPVHSSEKYLVEMLREELGYDGVVVTDYQDIEKLTYFHHIAETAAGGILYALRAQIDMSMVPMDYSFPIILSQLVDNGTVSLDVVRAHAARILQLKDDLGLLSDPTGMPPSSCIDQVGSEEDRQLALEAAEQSITLLQNRDQLLPLDKDTASNILVVGPAGNSIAALSGGWTLHWQGVEDDSEFPFGSSIFAGIKEWVSDSGWDSDVSFVQGASFTEILDINDVVTAAMEASVVILCVGEAPEAEWLGDISDLSLSSPQVSLFEAIRSNSNVPIVTIMVAARPRLFLDLANSEAMMMAYLPGPEGGEAIANILFGDVNPSGRLPITYPSQPNDVKVPYYHLYSQETAPLFPFGFGLSYSTFTYTSIEAPTTPVVIGETVNVSVSLKNDGPMAGHESVLLFIADLYASVAPPVKALKAIERVWLDVGESTTVSFALEEHSFSFIGRDLKRRVEPGEFVVTTGELSSTITLVPSVGSVEL